MVNRAPELVQSLDGWHVFLRCKSYGRNEPAAVRLGAVLALNQPLMPGLIEGGVRDSAVVVDVLADVELLV